MILIDTHAHLYSEEFKEDIELVITEAQQAGVQKIYLPAIDASAHTAMLQLVAKYPETCIPMMGLHPCYVKENYLEELATVQQYLQQQAFAAVGEIGLDFYWDKTFTQEQYEAFDTQMEWALQYRLPVVIHTRNAMQETINRVKPFAARGLKGIFHCFSGSKESAQQIIKMGFLLGIGGVITYKNSDLPHVIAQIPLEYLVLETDAPYLTPAPFRGKRNQSSYLTYIAQKIADAHQTDIATIADSTTRNAQKIFGDK